MQEYAFKCGRCGHRFDTSAEPDAPQNHILVSIATIGFSRMFHVYNRSRCPRCEKKSIFLLFLILILILLSLEICREILYFVVWAPQQIVRDASMASLPEDLDLNAPVNRENISQMMGFIWYAGAMPTVGAYLSTNWPYILLIWFSFVTLIGLTIPSFYFKKTKI